MSKYYVIILIAMLFVQTCIGQNNNSTNIFNHSNVTITDTTLSKIIDGFYKFIQVEKIKGNNALAIVRLQDYVDGATYIVIELYPIDVTNFQRDESLIYGFIMRDSFYCYFDRSYKYLERDSTILNPKMIKSPVLNFRKTKPNQKIPKPIYHPYSWEIVFKNGIVIEMFPKSTIEEYLAFP
jgi:hypothetical protein